MIQKKNSAVFNVFLAVVVLVIMSVPVSAYIIANESDVIFPDDDGTGGTGGTGDTNARSGNDWQANIDGLSSETLSETDIRGGVIEGAASILQAQADYLEFLNLIERSEREGLDYGKLMELADKAIAHTENAVATYDILVIRANASVYDSGLAEMLINFDYTAFGTSRGLNREILNRTQSFLERADVRGVYSELLDDSRGLLDRLKLVKTSVEADQFPPVFDLWRTNQAFSETVLFGQYVAEVFFQITGK